MREVVVVIGAPGVVAIVAAKYRYYYRSDCELSAIGKEVVEEKMLEQCRQCRLI